MSTRSRSTRTESATGASAAPWLAENSPGDDREEKRLAYERELRRILQRADTLDAEAMLSMRALVVDLQERVLGRIAAELSAGRAEGSWGAWWIPRLVRSLDDVFREMTKRVSAKVGSFMLDSWTLGAELFEMPTRAAYPELSILAPAVNYLTLTTVAPYSARLITSIDETTRNIVSKAIRTSVVLGESPSVLMADLAKSPLDKGPWRTLAYRTELVTRTEVSRLQTVSAEARLQQAVLDSPGLLKGPNGLKQVFTSVQIGEWPCPICRPLDGTVWDLDDPNKPVPPLHPGCRCQLSPFFPGISKIRSLPPTPSGQQRRASVVESCRGCCG